MYKKFECAVTRITKSIQSIFVWIVPKLKLKLDKYILSTNIYYPKNCKIIRLFLMSHIIILYTKIICL
jgi:hypothetical protein